MRLIVLWIGFIGALGIDVHGQATPLRDAPAKVVSGKPFEISKKAAAAGIDGILIVAVTVDKSGNVKKVDILAGPAWPCGKDVKKELAELHREVRENLLHAKFTPEIQNGKPYESDVLLRFYVGDAFNAEKRRRAREEAIRKGDLPPTSIDGGVLNSRAVRLPTPTYPAGARELKMSGTVRVELVVNEEGDPILAGIASGPKMFQDAARTAACSAKFAPAREDGKPAKLIGVVIYEFLARAPGDY